MKLIHITDLHLSASPRTIGGRDPEVSLAAAITDINRHHADAHLVVFSGDLSDDGSPTSYRILADKLQHLVPPARLTLGNHDDRDAFRSVFPDAPGTDGFVQFHEDTPAGRVICLDTLDQGAVGGRLCDRRLAWFEESLASAAGPALVFMHHPPMAIGMEPLDDCRLAEPERFAAVLKRHGNVRHIFAGHVHRAVSGSWCGAGFTTGRGTNHQTAPLFGATDFALGMERPAYNVVLIDGDDIVVHLNEIA